MTEFPETRQMGLDIEGSDVLRTDPTGAGVLAGGGDHVRQLSRSMVRGVECPACHAGVGEQCVGPRGKVRSANHMERVELATAMRPAVEWEEWLDDYRQVTGRRARGSQSAQRAFRARRREGWTLEELKLATRGCYATDFCRSNGYDVPETILRASKVEKYVLRGRGELTTGNGNGRKTLDQRLAHLDALKEGLA